MNPPLWRRMLWLLLSALLALGAGSAAAAELVVLLAARGPLQEAFLSAIQGEFGQRPGARALRVLEHDGGTRPPSFEAGTQVLAVGAEAARLALAGGAGSVLAVLVSNRDAEDLRRSAGNASVGAIVLDQPHSRSLRLVSAVMPGANSVAILLGSASATQRGALEAAARGLKLDPMVAEVASESAIVQALERLLDDGSALLAVPDASVYNRDTIMSILLTSYRHRRPVIGFSAAYVRAGAVAAVYSEPADIARQAAELLAPATPAAEPALSRVWPPKYFRVAVNDRVARSLGLAPGNEAQLAQQLRAAEGKP